MSSYRGDRGGRGGARGRGGGGDRGRGGGGPRGGGGGARGYGVGRGGGSGGRGGAPAGPPIVGQTGSLSSGSQRVLPTVGDHITTIGVKRPGYGTAGKVIKIMVNAFETSIPQTLIRHYDVVITPSEQTLPMALTMALIRQLQLDNPQVFTSPAVYDGRKNLFAAFELPLGPTGTNQFDVSLPVPGGAARPPKVYKIKLTKVAEINAEVLERFVRGDQSHDNYVLTAITALNVVIRMDPFLRYTFNVRSFFTNTGSQRIGLGLELWPGLFQSVRPGIGRMLINVDTSTALMYRSGPLITLCLEFLRKPVDEPAKWLTRQAGMPDRIRLSLSRFLSNVKVKVTSTTPGEGGGPARMIKKLSSLGANELTFSLREGGSMTVADYFRTTRNISLRFPNLFCVEIGSGALIPLELCEVVPGQIVRKQVPPEKTGDVVKFATKRPRDRLTRIVDGVQNTLAYGQSDYVREFGMNVNTAGPLLIEARVLKTPKLKYGKGSTVVPANGSWNMIDKKFFRPVAIKQWGVAVYERQDRFDEITIKALIKGLIKACETAGMTVTVQTPKWKYFNGQSNVVADLTAFGTKIYQETKQPPQLFLVVLPETGNDIYTSVKHFGDCVKGVATQCVKSHKSKNASSQYWANVALKLNVKLGGINVIPDGNELTGFVDPKKPTIIMGADVIHPAPGSEGRPSYTALVGNIDTDMAKYVAASRAQTSGQEMIDDEDLKEMAKTIIQDFIYYRTRMEQKPNGNPERIIFYRDGVSEGQFKQVLEQELPSLRSACKDLGISPKITVIIVGKRHHMRFFPENPQDEDRSGNCPAGTVVDTVVAHPTEFDFYLQSHGGLLGTSRSSHYSVLYDENKFSADAIQALSFALCHVYARSTRSVSIPAPVYYADIVCSRARNHYDPTNEALMSSESQTQQSLDEGRLQAYRSEFRQVHTNLTRTMYFS